jgi:hypothetical protein
MKINKAACSTQTAAIIGPRLYGYRWKKNATGKIPIISSGFSSDIGLTSEDTGRVGEEQPRNMLGDIFVS